jgi:xylose isomerase
MDAFARGLVYAQRMLGDAQLSELKNGRYRSFGSGPGQEFAAGSLTLSDLREHAAQNGEPELQSGKQELVENRMNDLMFR